MRTGDCGYTRANGSFVFEARIAHYKTPTRIIRLDEFPMTAGAHAPKVQKAKLREIAARLRL